MVAFHEAAHAVAALALGFAVHSARLLIPRGKTRVNAMDFLAYVASTTLPGRFKATRSPRHTRRAEARLIVLLAGREAELRLGWKGERGDGHDMDEAFALADEIAGRGPYSVVEADALLQLARVRARRLVCVRWREVRAVAEALIERRRLGGRELRAVVASNPVIRAQTAQRRRIS